MAALEVGATATAVEGQAVAERSHFSHPELNVLRLFAFLLVFFNHAQPVGWIGRYNQAGLYGVPLFFLLSAYLICTLLLREKEATGTIRVRWFVARRVLRIWPLFVVDLLAGYLLGRIMPDFAMRGPVLLAFLLMAGNVVIGRSGWTDSPCDVLWSLSVEEQFYLLIPFVVKRTGRTGLRLACLGVLLISYLDLIYFDHKRLGFDAVWTSSLVCFQFFALGGLLATTHRYRIRGRSLWKRAGLTFAGLLCFLVAARGCFLAEVQLRESYALDCLFAAGGALAIFLAFLGYPAQPGSTLGYLGVISYGLYVFHPWCLGAVALVEGSVHLPLHHRALLGNTAAFVLTTLIASASYRFLERPFLKLKRRFEVVHAQQA